MSEINLKARCKVNLSLDVLSELDNGYHEVKMIMQSVDLYDEISLKEDDDFSMTCDIPNLECDDSNLCMKAARAVDEFCQLPGGVHISLKKRVPFAAGLGGGSSDAAAVIIGLNKLYRLGLSTQEMMDIGATIGADVPFCVVGGTMLCQGIGEILTPIEPIMDYPIILAKPSIGVSTKWVYDNLDIEKIKHPDTDAMVAAIEAHDLEGICSTVGNVLESVTVTKYPLIDEIKNLMLDNGAKCSMMSGSGPTVFGIFANEADRDACMKALEDANLDLDLHACKFYRG